MGKKRKQLEWYEFTAKHGESTAELDIFGEIGGGFFFDEDAITGKAVAEQLAELPDSVTRIRVRVNSPGGNVFDAIQIANELRRQREENGRTVDVEIDALAASAATIITSSGGSIRMPRNAIFMVHNPSVGLVGDAEEFKAAASALERIKSAIVSTYRWVSSLTAKKLGALMDDATWMDADEALANGFVTAIAEPVKATASLGRAFLEQFEIPERFQDRIMALVEPEAGNGRSHKGDKMKKVKKNLIAPPAPVAPVAPVLAIAPPAPAIAPPAPVDPVAPVLAIAPPPTVTPAPEPAVDPAVAAAAAAVAERTRITAIQKVVTVAIVGGLDKAIAEQISEDAIAQGNTVEETRSALFDHLVQPAPGPAPGPSAIEGGEDEREKRIQGISAALWSRSGKLKLIRKAAAENPDAPEFQNISFEPAEFRGMSLLDHCRADLERMPASGGRFPTGQGSTSGLVKKELASRFLNVGGQQTTSDFAVALEEALNKVLLAAYLTTSDTWRRFCAVGTVSDFRAHNRYRQGFLSRLEVLVEGGEIRNKTIPDAVKEVQQAKTFANILSLSRTAIVNDDMGVFNSVAVTLGRAAALSIELEVYDALALNSDLGPDMNDGNPLFDASHGNIGAGAALSVASIDADAVLMQVQTDPSGNEILDLRPNVLLLAAGLGGAAKVLNQSQFDHDSDELHKPNSVVGLYDDIVATGRLSDTRRYSFADPNVAPVFEVAFLEGAEQPDVEMQDGWRTDGVEWKVVHDFGVAAIDFRGAVTNAGQ